MKKRRKKKNANDKTKKKIIVSVCVLLAFVLILGVSVYLNYIADLKNHPLKYEREVYASAQKHGIEAQLVFSVILVESHFTPDAVSHSGAQGLMQIMPETAEWVAWRQNKSYDKNRVFEPAYNIDMGCYLLSYLLDYYDGNAELALAAYNAGKNVVDSWIADETHFDGKQLIIPYPETRNYVKKVLNAYEKYGELYDEKFG